MLPPNFTPIPPSQFQPPQFSTQAPNNLINGFPNPMQHQHQQMAFQPPLPQLLQPTYPMASQRPITSMAGVPPAFPVPPGMPQPSVQSGSAMAAGPSQSTASMGMMPLLNGGSQPSMMPAGPPAMPQQSMMPPGSQGMPQPSMMPLGSQDQQSMKTMPLSNGGPQPQTPMMPPGPQPPSHGQVPSGPSNMPPGNSQQSANNYVNNFVNDFQNMNIQQPQYPQQPAFQQTIRYMDLMQERNLIKYGLEDNEISLPDSVCNPYVHCLPSIMRCTMSAIPESSELLNKCRLPLGLELQPFRDLKNLTVIQTTIVRCRYCRTYINPYVYISDNRHWKCNLCFRLNDLPEEFSWDPVTKSFGDPTRRPEIQNATIEYIAPSEYMLRSPQPALYLFILDVSANAVDCGYLHVFAEQLVANISLMPGDERTMMGFLGVDTGLHFFQFTDVNVPPKHMIVHDVDEPFFPVNYGLFVELKEFKETITDFIQSLPTLFESNNADGCCLGAALDIARDLIFDIGGRVSVFITTPVNVGPGALNTGENAASKTTKLRASSDFYKTIALECTGKQIGIDLFVLGERYVDIATLADIAKYSSGSVYHFPRFHLIRNSVEVLRFKRTLVRYFTRKIGFEAVLRIRCSKGVSLHTFHGNFFVRSTDLLAMANVNPDSAMGVQVQIEESLINQRCVCFQAALLYTSSKGDRRIRVHTLCVPVEREMSKIFQHFDAKAAVSLLAKMAAERAMSGADLADCREALMNAATDALSMYNRSVGARSTSIFVPIEGQLKYMALYVLGLIKNNALSGSVSTASRDAPNVDERVATMLLFKTAPLEKILLTVYPALYAVHSLMENADFPPRLPLSYEYVNREGVYLLDTGSFVYLFVCANVNAVVIEQIFGINAFTKIDEDMSLEQLSNPLSARLHEFIRYRFDERGKLFAPLLILREDGPSRHLFTSRLVEDRTESSHSYVEFLQLIRREISNN